MVLDAELTIGEVSERSGLAVSAIRFYEVGLTLDEISDALGALPADVAPSGAEWKELSAAWRPLLDERIELLVALRDQLDHCIGCGCLSLDRCRLSNPADRAARHGAGARYLLGDQRPG